MSCVVRILRLPIDDYTAALAVCMRHALAVRAAVVIIAFAVSWFIYVPIHELLHAFGCLIAGGEVTRLEIDPIYGAAFLRRFFPFVVVGSQYAGQLTGFDTHGNDLIYLATDLAPFTLTVLFGVPLLRAAGRPRAHPLSSCLALGAAAPIAYAPFISLTGDYYEMGSILVSRCAHWWQPSLPLARWRSDDLVKLTGALFGSGGNGGVSDVGGLSAAFLVGAALAFATYWLGWQLSELWQRRGQAHERGHRLDRAQ